MSRLAAAIFSSMVSLSLATLAAEPHMYPPLPGMQGKHHAISSAHNILSLIKAAIFSSRTPRVFRARVKAITAWKRCLELEHFGQITNIFFLSYNKD